MTGTAKLMLSVAILLAVGVAVASVSDRKQREKFDEINSNIHTPSQRETRDTVMAKLGKPNAIASTAGENDPGCRERYYYRPTIRLLDEEYLVCFDTTGRAVHAAYLVSQ